MNNLIVPCSSAFLCYGLQSQSPTGTHVYACVGMDCNPRVQGTPGRRLATPSPEEPFWGFGCNTPFNFFLGLGNVLLDSEYVPKGVSWFAEWLHHDFPTLSDKLRHRDIWEQTLLLRKAAAVQVVLALRQMVVEVTARDLRANVAILLN